MVLEIDILAQVTPICVSPLPSMVLTTKYGNEDTDIRYAQLTSGKIPCHEH